MCIPHLHIILFCGFRGFTKVDEAWLFSSEKRHQLQFYSLKHVLLLTCTSQKVWNSYTYDI